MLVIRSTVLLITALSAAPACLAAQQWNDDRVLALVRQATERRAQQLADSGLGDYSATAHGYVTFLAQFGEGFREPPQVVKADELALEVYWRAPNLSKQRIVGRRDTTLLPTDIQYHRDHLGIVQNNFPAIIRLGDGDEVRDVPHPLSPGGLADYDFALSDSLRITFPGRSISVYEVKVRPKVDREPRVIGALYLDRDNGAVVRMALSFTRAAFLDKQLEDLFVVLENGLVGTRFWLPRRQEIEIRRTATWLDYPARGIIRGRWEIGNYELNTGLPRQQFIGPEIIQMPGATARRQWDSANILDSLPPDVRAVTAEEIRRVQAEVRTLVREQALERARGSALAARGISDFVRFNRVEGLALGAGVSARLGGGVSAMAQGRYGLEDQAVKGRAEVAWERASGTSLRVFAADGFREVGELQERSLVTNSLTSQEFGSDYTDPYGVRAFGAALGFRRLGLSWTLEGSRERQYALQVRATPASGRFEGTVPAILARETRASLVAERPTSLWPGGIEGRMRGEIRAFFPDEKYCVQRVGPSCAPGTQGTRFGVDVEMQRALGGTRLVGRTIGAVLEAPDKARAQDLIFLGGPVSAPGYDHHSLVGSAALSQRLELRLPVPFPALSLGRFGRSAASATLALFAGVAVLRGADSARVLTSGPAASRALAVPGGSYPSVGAGLLMFFDLLRLDVARGLRDGRWTFSLDVNRAFWRVL